MASFGAYEIVFALKEGGMGEVLLARRRGPIDRLVAIKTIRAELAGAAPVRAMFLDEAGILSRLGHPAVASVHDFGEEGQTLYLVMEYVAGISFSDLIARRPPPAIAARAIAEACRGLHAAHELRDLAGNVLGIVHRDISPENLMLGYDGHVKVIDFGIALVKNRQAPVTELGTIKGKPPYMSPEQVKNESIDRQSDVFSLAVVAHELLTGQPLFEGDSIYAVARAVEHAELAPPSRLAGALPPGLDAAVMRGLERDRTQRTPTAAAFAEELEAAVMASGGETLEAWAERELADARDAHRRWLAEVMSGSAGAKLGRPTGAVTALPAIPVGRNTATPVARVPEGPVGDESEAAPVAARRPRWGLIVLLVFVLAGAAAWVAMRALGPAGAVDARAVVIDGRSMVIDAAAPRSPDAAMAAIDAHPVVIEAPPADAVPPSPVHDARGRPTRDAAAVVPRPDAAEHAAVIDAPKSTGFGYVKITANPFAQVRIDNQDYGATPLMHQKLPAGTHHIVLTSADHSEVRVDRTIELAPGQTISISP